MLCPTSPKCSLKRRLHFGEVGHSTHRISHNLWGRKKELGAFLEFNNVAAEGEFGKSRFTSAAGRAMNYCSLVYALKPSNSVVFWEGFWKMTL